MVRLCASCPGRLLALPHPRSGEPAGGPDQSCSNYLFIRVGLKALLRLRTDLYACLQSLPLKYHDARRSSDSSFRVAYDSQSIQTIYNKGFATILSSIVMLVWTFGIMVWMNWPLALTSLAVLPFVTWAIGYFADRVRRQSTTIQERESDLLALTQEGISQIRMVHAFGRESFEIRQFRKRAARSLEAGLRFNITSIVSSLVVGTLMAAGTALMYYVGARQVLAGALTLGDLTVFATYLLMLYQPLEQLSYTAWAMEGAAAGAARCFEVLDREDDVPDAPNAKPIDKARGDIEIPRRQLRLFPRPSHLERHQPIDRARRKRGLCGRNRSGQEHLAEPRAALL